MSSALPQGAQGFLEAFKIAGGWYDASLFSLQQFTGMGWGGVALRDIEPDTPLFHIPSSLLLTPYTSSLASKLSEAEWTALEVGWARLILVMMYETALGSASRWHAYLDSMPREFDTPMFWDEARQSELIGTDLEGRIGREDADRQYHEVVKPIIDAHPELFSPSAEFSLDAYHLQGSRILSRSFTIPLSKAGGPSPDPAQNSDDEDDSDDDEGDGPHTAAMVIMADMLNAAYESDNARLWDTEDEALEHAEPQREAWQSPGYTMRSTKPIKAGEQIYNTYDSPPNSELLRKYGHVDELPLPQGYLQVLTPEEIGSYPLGNAGDEVLISGDVVVGCIASASGRSQEEGKGVWGARIDWWLEEGHEDSFPLTYDAPVNEDLVSFVRLLVVDSEWERAERKGKRPHAIMDPSTAGTVVAAIKARQSRYGGSIKDDLSVIAGTAPGDRRAAIVRLGEKRILAIAERATLAAVVPEDDPPAKDKKRKANGQGGPKLKMR